MTKIDRRGALRTLGATATVGFAGWTLPMPAQETPLRPPEGGIGGTGIVGLLTDFGSVIVNGLRVVTDADPLVTNAFGPMELADLQRGHALTLEARAYADGHLEAARIHVAHPVIGRVGHVAGDGRSGVVAGVAVRLEDGATGTLARGTQVAVSGLWQGNQVVAARIDTVEQTQTVLAGQVTTVTPDAFVIGGRRVAMGGQTPPVAGTYVTVVGTDRGNRLDPISITSGRFFGTAGALTQLSVEGYLQPRAGAPFFEVSGLGHSFDTAAQLRPFAGERTLFSGAYTGAFSVETGRALPEGISARQALGQQVLDGTAPLAQPAR